MPRALSLAISLSIALPGCSVLGIGGPSLSTRRAEYLAANPDLAPYKVAKINAGRATVGMTVLECELALGAPLSLVRSSSDGTEVYKLGTGTLLFFRLGQLANWTTYR